MAMATGSASGAADKAATATTTAAAAVATTAPVFRLAHKALLRKHKPLFLSQPQLIAHLEPLADAPQPTTAAQSDESHLLATEQPQAVQPTAAGAHFSQENKPESRPAKRAHTEADPDGQPQPATAASQPVSADAGHCVPVHSSTADSKGSTHPPSAQHDSEAPSQALLTPASQWTVKRIRGAWWIRGAIDGALQQQLAVEALTTWSEPTVSRANIDAHDPSARAAGALWPRAQSGLDSQASSKLAKISWLTLGYHYDWTDKVYKAEDHSVMPPLLADLCRQLAQALGLGDFDAQAGIINFYATDGFLGPHTDHSERNLRAPLISISLGLPALLLLGGQTLDQPPSALRLLR